MPDHETFLFTEERSEDLEPDREFDTGIIWRSCESDRNCESWNPRERCRNREDILEIECEGIISFLSDLPGNRRCGRRDEDIYLRECFRKILSNELTHTRCFFVIRIIESG